MVLNGSTTLATYGSLGHFLEGPMEHQQLTGKEKGHNAPARMSFQHFMDSGSDEVKTD